VASKTIVRPHFMSTWQKVHKMYLFIYFAFECSIIVYIRRKINARCTKDFWLRNWRRGVRDRQGQDSKKCRDLRWSIVAERKRRVGSRQVQSVTYAARLPPSFSSLRRDAIQQIRFTRFTLLKFPSSCSIAALASSKVSFDEDENICFCLCIINI